MKNLHSGFWPMQCLLAIIFPAMVVGCNGSNEGKPHSERMARTSIIDTQSVALNDRIPEKQSRGYRPRLLRDKAIDMNANRSVINMRLHSNNDYLLTDPEGRKTGIEPLSGGSFVEIPHSTYETIGIRDLVTEKVGPTSKELTVSEPVDGDYSIRIIGTREERYSLEIRAYNRAGNFGRLIVRDTPIEVYAIHAYGLRYRKGNEKDLDNVTLRGGYDGTCEEGDDGNILLSYFTCSSSEIELPTITKQYWLGIWYYEGADPKSFSATLNGEDVTALFTPRANSNEIVTLSLSQGSNSLVLKIEEDAQSQRRIDTDTFEISITP